MKIIRLTLAYGEKTVDENGVRTFEPEIVREHEITSLSGDLLNLDENWLHMAVHKAYWVLRRDAALRESNAPYP
jgi:hypothetical protein